MLKKIFETLYVYWNKSYHQRLIEKFMLKGNQKVPSRPRLPIGDIQLLRARLVFEEALELVEALGMQVRVLDGVSITTCLRKDNFSVAINPQYPLIELADIAKECADLSVVTIGTLSACGICDKPLLEAVDRNNLEKFGAGSYIDNYGKIIKPPNHKKPDVASILAKQA